MSTHNIPFSILKKMKKKIILNNPKYWILFKGLKNEFKTAMVNKPSMFEPLKVHCNKMLCHSTVNSGKVIHRSSFVKRR